MGRIASVIILMLLLAINMFSVPEVVRLHVIANSDLPEDQELKEKVRDQLVVALSPALKKMDSRQAEQFVLTNQDWIEKIATDVLVQEGVQAPVLVKYSVETYPSRLYGSLIVPAGRYRSLQVVIGDGEGKNWWCLLFPPLCFVDEVTDQDAEGYAHTIRCNDGEQKEVSVRFWLVDRVRDIWKQIGGMKDE